MGRLPGPRPRPRLTGRRGRRRRRGRPGRVRRRLVHARRAGGPGADDLARAGGRVRRRQGRGQPPAGQESDRRLPPAAARPDRSGDAADAAGARVSLRARRGREDGGRARRGPLRLAGERAGRAPAARSDSARGRGGRLLRGEGPDRRAGRARGDRRAHGAELRAHRRPRSRGRCRATAGGSTARPWPSGWPPPGVWRCVSAGRTAGTADRQEALLRGVGLPVRFTDIDPRQIADALRHDKKARDGRVPFVLLRTLGRAELCHDVPMETVIEVLREIQG